MLHLVVVQGVTWIAVKYGSGDLMASRKRIAERRLGELLGVMRNEVLAPAEKLNQLREELAEYHETTEFDQCRTMGDLVQTNLEVCLRGL